jgi:hypothetical protein
MKKIKQKHFEGERSLFKSRDLDIEDSIFENGESPLKESQNIHLKNSIFRWKYPLWYCKNIIVNDSQLLETARSGIWYTHYIDIHNSTIEAPKTFRKSSHIQLNNVHMPISLETFWNCDDIYLNNVNAKGDYFALNSSNIKVKNLNLTGNYSFDSCKNIEIHDSTLISKDAFWNCENVIVYNSTIIGEYLAWNSKNITFINCTIESLQGLCYIDHLKMVNCKLLNTTLSFEYCQNIDVQINSHIDSIKNPISGIINAISIGEMIIDENEVHKDNVKINVLEG